MEQNYKLRQTYPFLYSISNNDTMNTLMLLCYSFSCLLNIFVLFFFKLDDGDGEIANSRKLTATNWAQKLHDISSIVFGAICLFILLIWLILRSGSVYSKVSLQYMIKHPEVHVPFDFKNRMHVSIVLVFL